MAIVLYFPEDDFASPPRVSTREIARMKIAEFLAKRYARVSRARCEAIPAVLNHFDDCAMSDTGEGQNVANRSASASLQGASDRDSCWTEPPTPVVTVSTDEREATMREITPPLVKAEDRGKGDSVNAAMHRVMYPKGTA